MDRHSFRRYCCSLLLLGANTLIVPAAYAGGFLRLDTGIARLGDSRFDSTTVNRLTGGYGFGPVSVVVSAYQFDNFTLDGNPDAELELNGASVEAFWTAETGPLAVNLGGGVFDWDSKTTLYGRTFGRDSGTSGMLEAGVGLSFGSLARVYLNARLIEGLSDEDMTTLSGGVQFTF